MKLPPLFLSLLLSASLAAQIPVQQLQKELAAHPQQDTIRVNRLNALCLETSIPGRQRIKYAEEALGISKKISYTHGEAMALANTGYFTGRLGNKREGDSMLAQAQKIADKTGDAEVTGIIALRSALLLFDKDKSAMDYLLRAEQAFEKSGNQNLLLSCQELIATQYSIRLTDYAKGMEYHLKAMQLAEKLGLRRDVLAEQQALAAVYSALGDHNNALALLKKTEADAKNVAVDSTFTSNMFNAFGEEYRLTGRYAEAILAYKQAIASISSNVIDVTDESNLADVYTRLDSLPLAFYYAFHSLAASREQQTNFITPWIYGILSRAYLKKGMTDSAVYYARTGLDSALQTGTIEFMRDNAEALANAYAFKKDFANAYNYHLKYINYRDSMLSAEVRNKTAVLQYNADIEKKQSQITQLNEQKKAQQKFLTGALIALSLIVILAVLLLRNNGQKRKANHLLQQQKQEIDDKANELSTQKDNLELLGHIGQQVSASLSVERIISTVYDNVNALMAANVFGIGIYNEAMQQIEFPATYESGKALPFYVNAIDDPNRFAPVCLNSGREIIIGDLHKEYHEYIEQLSAPNEGEQPLSLIFLPLKIKDRKLGVITVQSFTLNAYTEYHLFMLRNIAVYTAIALDNAESYQELNNTLANLKKAQGLLIQSEKMASLGELTAGIAHEIQNPLNFVNNFSEINAELIAEMSEELQEGNVAEAQSIANNIRENEKKIMLHGRRADGIVKGMLQHSRGSSTIKQLTDINALCEEYLKLSYHGLRARDNTFNSVMETHFDEKAGHVNIVPQDIGRVLLNLYNNSFYAVHEKKKLLADGFEPVISISTKKEAHHILIHIKDNGTGIPKKVIEKIFQPFFTTKPTGQGTGLGLSLSYDIVKAHGGEIKIETQEGEGSMFVIVLPTKE